MIRKRIIAIFVSLVAVLVLALLPGYYVRDGAAGYLIWNSTEAYLFVGVFQYGYTFSHLRYIGEIVREIFPFGASSPQNKHAYTVILHITPDTLQSYSFDSFVISHPIVAIGKIVSIGKYPTSTGPLKWTGTHFEAMSPEEEKELRGNFLKIPPGPAYDNFGGWSMRTLDLVSPGSANKLTFALSGDLLTLSTQSGLDRKGVVVREAFIDLSRSGRDPERIWHLNEKTRRIDKAAYTQIFGFNP